MKGNEALAGYSGKVYAHTGVITSNSTSGTDWKYVKGIWGTNNAPEMTSLGNDKYSISINNVRNYYGVPGGETIEKIAILFRNEDGSKVGRMTDGSDILIDIFTSGLFATFSMPLENQIYLLNDAVDLEATSSTSASLKITLNGNVVATATGTSIAHSFKAVTPGNYTAIVEASNSGDSAKDTVKFVINPNVKTVALPKNLKHGINFGIPGSITLVLYAPFKEYVYVLGDFNDWSANTNYFMNRDVDGSTYWLEINDLIPNEKYAFQYFVDGKIKIADPYSELVLDPNNDPWIPAETYPNPHLYPAGKTSGIATLVELDRPSFNWSTFTAPQENELVVYELLIRDFVSKHNYQTLVDTLDYLENLGINAIELMPVNEFEGNESWGYNPSFHMALDKYYGIPLDFKRFVNECHKRGIAIILDVVYNHAFSQSPLCQLYWDAANFKPLIANPFVNPDAKHDFNVGYDLNHESPALRNFLKQVMTYWLTEYNVDGFRFDLSKGFTQNNTLGNTGAWGQYDASRVANIKRIYDEIKAVNSDAYVILEHFSDNSEERDLANYGCMFWGNLNNDGLEASMGYNSNFVGADYKNRGWNNPKLIGFIESHDEERLMYKNLKFGNSDNGYDIKDINTALDRMELTYVLFSSIPGPKMIWQFGELGYDYSIDYNGRVGNKPIEWDYNKASNRRDVYEVFSEINGLKTKYDAFTTNDYSLDIGGKGKRIHLNNNDMNVVVLGNFDVSGINMSAGFQHTGMWYEYFSGDSLNVSDVNVSLDFDAGEYQLWTDKFLNPSLSIGAVSKPNLKFDVYPNPVKSQLVVNNTSIKFTSYQIMDVTGKVIREVNLDELGQEFNINVSDLDSGTYLLSLQKGAIASCQKFIKL